MDSLRHNGIRVLEPPPPRGLSITVRGEKVLLNQLQEEMAVAWVRKLGTPYVEDPVFVRNFMTDFGKALGVEEPLSVDDIDFTEVIRVVEEERARKEAMSKEEKKADRERRKAERERLKEQYGYAIVDGERMELGNYQTEPSGIFMGRGEHPLRGRWKRGATKKDITLNIDAEGMKSLKDQGWGEFIWAPDCMWIAKWTDELTGKVKYIWLHDSTPIKQEREAAKFDKALKVERHIDEIRSHILAGLESDDAKRRMVAAACYLIDKLSLRVGDEKDPDEADTVGATTLRVEHLTLKDKSIVFDFLGKDSVPWHKELEIPPEVYTVFEELYENAKDRVESFKTRKGKRTRADPKKLAQIFPRVNSTHVNRFLGEVYPDLTAKVFRTYHASVVMREELKNSRVRRTDPDFLKKAALKRANLEVARVMNHTKQAPKGWSRSDERYQERIKKAEARVEVAKRNLAEKRKRLRAIKKKEAAARTKKLNLIKRQKEIVAKNMASVRTWREKRDAAKVSWDNARANKSRIRSSKRKGKVSKKERLELAQERIDRMRARLDAAESSLASARARYQKSKNALLKKQESFATFKERSEARVSRAENAVERARERVKKAELAVRKIRTDYALAKESRTWNLGTSLKSYVHPKIIYKWCKRVDYDWRKAYSSTLQRKFAWVES
ncbi:MAG: DNA topoisomerase I [Candidatus Thorarchaeota archaeon]|nr:MAG: DNA topoisomerase I [Candidatus Thorarchaeota archaeon]RLI54869.1 MAG: DNA topoisomerase I [Candidatus Thorarchaeota archaeon]